VPNGGVLILPPATAVEVVHPYRPPGGLVSPPLPSPAPKHHTPCASPHDSHRHAGDAVGGAPPCSMVPCSAVSTSAAPSAPSVTDARKVTPRSRHGSSQPSTDSTWAVGTFPARATRPAPPTRPLLHSSATVGTSRGGWALWHQVRGTHKIEGLATDDVQVASSICARKDGEGGLKTTAMTSCRAA